MDKAKKLYRPSFYFTVNSLFLLLILGVGAVLSRHNYQATKKIVLAQVRQSYEQTSREVSADFVRTYRAVFQNIGLLSFSRVSFAATLEERLRSLDMFSTALRNEPQMTALQVGYSNGEYFIVRSLRSDRVKEFFQAPDQAAFSVDHIAADPADGKRYLVRLFFDAGLKEVSRNTPAITGYDPRLRPWYQQAVSTTRIRATPPYLFYFSREIGTTVSYNPPGTAVVLGADVTLKQLSDTLAENVLTPNSEIVLFDYQGMVWGYKDFSKVIARQDDERFDRAELSELGSDVLADIRKKIRLEDGPLEFSFHGEAWQGYLRELNVSGQEERTVYLLMISPRSELLADAILMVKRSLWVTLALLLLSIPAATLLASRLSRALHALAGEAEMIRRFDFARPVSVRSRIKEVDELSISMDMMKSTINRFLSLIRSLADERNFDAMLEQITRETMKVSRAGGVLTCLVDEDDKILKPGVLFEQTDGLVDVSGLPALSLDSASELVRVVREKKICHFQLSRDREEEMGALLSLFAVDALQVTALPLQDRQEEVIGLLCLLNRAAGGEEKGGAGKERLDFVRAFSGFAAVSLESRHLLEMQKRLMDSFMHLLAGAIDAKSPYTGGHCQRVPVITRMLAEAACEDEGLFRDYQLDEEGWEAVHLAGWLHDCGKVTTPEYVVDKSTKLETIYDRIHEVRTRFEVLKRDAEIRYWEQVADGGDKEALRSSLQREWQELDDDFAFVAQCNLGGEFMAPERIERLEKIARRTWQRTLDDRIGISWEEAARKERVPRPSLPVEEFLLADRPEHLIERTENERMAADNPWGFRMDVPEYRYNRGELYNLRVARGTLTAEERFKINDHIVQTIIMLEKLPYPKHLRQTPEIAGGHHETMDGKGYPRRLTGDRMSLTARMMAIADIYEALTASDRPYKKAKKLSDTIHIMHMMKQEHHIDPDLFDLFLRSGVYLRYAEQYLDPEQLDEVEIENYIR